MKEMGRLHTGRSMIQFSTCKDGKGGYRNETRGVGRAKKPQQDSRHEGTAETKLLLGLLNMMLKE